MKTLHVCNLANVAYGFSKMMKSRGHDVRVICHDINHLMSQPEWDDDELDFLTFPNENNFFENSGGVALTRPEWYQRVDIGSAREPYRRIIARLAPGWLKTALRPTYYRVTYPDVCARQRVLQAMVSTDGEQGVRADDATIFMPRVDWLQRLRTDEDVLFAYVLAPIYALLAPRKVPVVAVEIGTMREVPFAESPTSRLLRAAYRAADHVIITNPDVKAQAEQLGLTRYSFCPHPVDEDRYRPIRDDAYRMELLQSFDDTEWIGVAPARQNWTLKGNQKYLEALREVRLVHGAKVSLIVPTWGQDVELSQDYARKLGIEKYVAWVRPVNESTLIRLFSNCDFVLDQFELGVFGLITPKALACNATVITSYDAPVHEWCFSEPPPLFPATSALEIVDQIMRVTQGVKPDPSPRNWFISHHSKAVVLTALERAALQAVEHFRKDNEAVAPS